MALRTVVLAVVLVLFQAGRAGAQSTATVVDAIAATVNGEVVTASDIRAARLLEPRPGDSDRAVVDRLVVRLLMLAEVDRAGQPLPSTLDIAARRQTIERRLGDELPVLHQRDGLTPARLDAWVADTLRLDAYVAQRFTAAAQPTDEEVAERVALAARAGASAGTDDESARAALVEVRRGALVEAWVEGLRQRADIRVASR